MFGSLKNLISSLIEMGGYKISRTRIAGSQPPRYLPV